MNCYTCKKEILKYIAPGQLKRNKHNFCSRPCYVIYWAKQRSGEKNVHWNKEIVIRKCPVCSKEFRRKSRRGIPPTFCSYKCKGISQKETFSGENNPRWNGGTTEESDQIRHSDEYIAWRNACGTRDGIKCQFCGAGHKAGLVVHHIKTFEKYPKLRFVVSNGITLCRACHMKLHAEHRGVHDFTKILNDYMPNVSRKALKI